MKFPFFRPYHRPWLAHDISWAFLVQVYKALDQQAAHIVAIKQVSLGGLQSGDISLSEQMQKKKKNINDVRHGCMCDVCSAYAWT